MEKQQEGKTKPRCPRPGGWGATPKSGGEKIMHMISDSCRVRRATELETSGVKLILNPCIPVAVLVLFCGVGTVYLAFIWSITYPVTYNQTRWIEKPYGRS